MLNKKLSRNNWKILHLTEFFYTTSGCDGCDKYQVCRHQGCIHTHVYLFPHQYDHTEAIQSYFDIVWVDFILVKFVDVASGADPYVHHQTYPLSIILYPLSIHQNL